MPSITDRSQYEPYETQKENVGNILWKVPSPSRLYRCSRSSFTFRNWKVHWYRLRFWRRSYPCDSSLLRIFFGSLLLENGLGWPRRHLSPSELTTKERSKPNHKRLIWTYQEHQRKILRDKLESLIESSLKKVKIHFTWRPVSWVQQQLEISRLNNVCSW